MTRYARAKGSKASNERLPAEATPWHVMKQQIETATASGKENSQKPKNAKELLKEKDDPYYCDTVVNNNDWAEFDTDKSSKNVKKNVSVKADKKSPKKRVNSKKENGNDSSVPADKSKLDKSKSDEPKADKSKPNKTRKRKLVEAETGDVANKSIEENVPKMKKKKKNKPISKTENSEATDKAGDEKSEENTKEKNKTGVKLSKRQKRNRKNKIKNENGENKEVNTPISFDVEGNDWNADIKFGKPRDSKPKTENNNYPNNYRDKRFNQSVKNQRPGKVRDNLEHKRRKPEPGAQRVIINGMEVDIVLYDGFPVRKDDADRLKELREKMVINGIPKSEIDRAMKLERRKAEKALARIRKNVCFHCRKAGHNLSDCPELGREEAATGICFKCGSTEHTHFECKVYKKEEFRFATCFICREQGHIAKQCPDNPKGLYPQGGACKICGDVTHLKKDCPELTSQKEGAKITLNTIADVDSVETIDGVDNKKPAASESEKPKKIIKF
ncbi:uncharacterized protein LOC103571033 [Microplitis demolitor]|uniref:uncharacterized protein LOC103571033 n=1 Tax=Microplitis demolitor TaxID=69319 RepID=UPI0004CCD7C3|nr:uncharacterized protein LOC103571033 [Microplitis demolitor]